MEAPDSPAAEPVTAESLKLAGNDLFKEKKYREALEKYDEAIALEPTNAVFYGNKSACELEMGRLQTCIETCEKALELDPGFVRCMLRAGKCHFQLGHSEKALDFFNRALLREPKNTQALEQRALVERTVAQVARARRAIDSKDYASALLALDEALKVATFSPDVLRLQADVLLATKQYAKAQGITVALLRDNPSDTEALLLRARCLYYQNQNEQAVQLLQNVMRLDPDNRAAFMLLKRVRTLEEKKKAGNAAFNSGRFQEAHDLYTEALQLDPDHVTLSAQLFCNRAAALGKLNRPLDGIADCTRALELDSQYAKALSRRAQLRLQAEQFDEAVHDYEAAARLDPENADTQRNLKHAKLELKKSKRKDWYKILEVPRDADETALKKAYRRLALQYHPDKNNETPEAHKIAEEKFKDISEAYQILSDPKKRRRFDSGADMDDDHFGGGGGAGGVDVNDIFSMFFGGGGHPGFGSARHSSFHGNPFAGSDDDDDDDGGQYHQFHSSFNGFPPRSQSSMPRGRGRHHH